MAETQWNRTHRWLIAGVVLNMLGVISGFVSNRIGEPGWLTAVRGVLTVIAVACLVVFFVKWRQRDRDRLGS